MSNGRLTARIALAAAAGLAGLAAGGCGGGGGGGGSSSSDASASYLAAVTRAAYATDRVPGYKFAIETTTEVGGKSIAVEGTGSINDRGSEGAASLQFDGKTINEVIEKPFLYVSVPSGANTRTTKGKPWVRADLSTFSQPYGSASIGPSSSNPTEVLSYLQSAGTVTRVGSEEVRGVASTHYHALIDLARFALAAPAGQRVAAQRVGQMLERVTGAKTLPMDVWIGGGRIARVSLAFSLCSSEGRVHESISTDLYDYGRQPVVTPPAASEVTDIAAELKSEVTKSLAQLGCH